MSKTIFITGASRGFGKIWAEAFLKRGDKVAATSRKCVPPIFDQGVLGSLTRYSGAN